MIVINQQSIKSKPIIQIKRIIVQTRGVSNYLKFRISAEFAKRTNYVKALDFNILTLNLYLKFSW